MLERVKKSHQPLVDVVKSWALHSRIGEVIRYFVSLRTPSRTQIGRYLHLGLRLNGHRSNCLLVIKEIFATVFIAIQDF